MRTDIALGTHLGIADGTGSNHKTLLMATAVVGLILFLALVRLLRLRDLHPGGGTTPPHRRARNTRE